MRVDICSLLLLFLENICAHPCPRVNTNRAYALALIYLQTTFPGCMEPALFSDIVLCVKLSTRMLHDVTMATTTFL